MSEPPSTKDLPRDVTPRGEDSGARLAEPPPDPGGEVSAPSSTGMRAEPNAPRSEPSSGTAPIVADDEPARLGTADGAESLLDPRSMFGRLIADRYRIVDQLAAGGIGAVYLAEHVVLKSPVAMKLLQPEAGNLPELVERFQREAVVGAHIKHPHIASATDFGALPDGSYYLVLELVEGVTLDELLKQGPLPPSRAVAIARQIADALSALHERGVVHRDVKPGNVMLLERGGVTRGTDFVKLIDFGLARLDPNRLPVGGADDIEPDERLTSAGVVVGTVAYMSPEAGQGMEVVDERSDLYALGVVLYRMLAGRHPFDSRNDVELFQKHLHESPPPFAVRAPQVSVPARLEAVVLRLLAKDPAERFQSAGAVVEALAPLLEGASDDPPPQEPDVSAPPPALAAPEPVRRRFGGWWLGGLVGVSLLGGGLVWVLRGHHRPALATGTAGLPTASALAPATGEATSAAGPPRASASAVPSQTPTPAPLDPGRPHPVARAQFSRAVRDRAWIAAFAAFEQLVAADAGYFSTLHAQRDTERLFAALAHAQVPEARVMTRLLANDLGEAGHDVLLKAVMLRGGSRAHALASEVLRRPEVVKQLAPEPAIALQLNDLGCDVSQELLDEAVRIGDGRALTMLAVQRERCPHDEARRRAYRSLEKRLLAEQSAAAQ